MYFFFFCSRHQFQPELSPIIKHLFFHLNCQLAKLSPAWTEGVSSDKVQQLFIILIIFLSHPLLCLQVLFFLYIYIFASSLLSSRKGDKGRENNPLQTLCHHFSCMQEDQQLKLSLYTPVKWKGNRRSCHFYRDKRQKQNKKYGSDTNGSIDMIKPPEE